jgi:hypothetical protein
MWGCARESDSPHHIMPPFVSCLLTPLTSDETPTEHLRSVKMAWRNTLRAAGICYFRIYDLQSAYATRLSAGGVGCERVIQMPRRADFSSFQGVFPNEVADEMGCPGKTQLPSQQNDRHAVPESARQRRFWQSSGTVIVKTGGINFWNGSKWFRIRFATTKRP